MDCSASLQKVVREQAAALAEHMSRAKGASLESMSTYWKVDHQKALRFIMCSHVSIRSDVAMDRLCSPMLKVPVEAPYVHLKQAPTLDDMPRCQLCARTCGTIHSTLVQPPLPALSKAKQTHTLVKKVSSSNSFQAIAVEAQVLQVASEGTASDEEAPEQATANARGIMGAHNKRAKGLQPEAAALQSAVPSSSDITGAYTLTYRMLCKFPESQVVSFLRRMKKLGGVAASEVNKFQDRQALSSDEEVLCVVPDSQQDSATGAKSTWLHDDVRAILERGASKFARHQGSRKSYSELKLVPIPTIIKHLEPHLSVAAYNKAMDTVEFNSKRVQICQVCYARYSSFVLADRFERIHEIVQPNGALKLQLANINPCMPAAFHSARSHAAPKACARPNASQRNGASAQAAVQARQCNGQMVRGVRLMLNELQVPIAESSHTSSSSGSDEDSESFFTDEVERPLHTALPSVGRLFQSISGAYWPEICEEAVKFPAELQSKDHILTFAKWMNFCKTFSVTQRLPIQKQDCIDCFKDANLGSLQRLMAVEDFSTCLLLLAVKSGILSLSDCHPSKPKLSVAKMELKPPSAGAFAAESNFSLKISSAIDLINKSDRDGASHGSIRSELAALFPSQERIPSLPNSARSALPTQRTKQVLKVVKVQKNGRSVGAVEPLPIMHAALNDKFTVDTKSAQRDNLYSGKAHLRRLRYNSVVCCPRVVRGTMLVLRNLHIVDRDASPPGGSGNINFHDSLPLWRLQPIFCKLFSEASIVSHNMISNMGTRNKTLNLGEWSAWCSERKVCDHLNMRKSDAISCFLMAGGMVTGCELDLEGFCACFIQLAVLAGFLSADLLLDFFNPLVETDASRTNALFGIDISPSREIDSFIDTEPTSSALWERLPAIKAWFKEAASAGGVSFGNRGKLVSLTEWQNFCRKVGFASLGLSRSDMTFAFVNGFAPEYSEGGAVVRQDVYEARLSEFSQSIIVIAIRAGLIAAGPRSTLPSADNCDEDTLEAVRQMFSRLSVPVSNSGISSEVFCESASMHLPKKSMFASRFKQFLVRSFDSRDQASLDLVVHPLPDMLHCVQQLYTDICDRMSLDAVYATSPATGFETTQFWIKFCLQTHASERLHLRLVDAITCVLAADPAASQYRRSAPMTLELFSQCLLHLAQRSKFLLREDADALPRAMQCRGCAILAVAFMLISLRQAPEVLSQDIYLKILANTGKIDPRSSVDNPTIAAPKSTQDILDTLLQVHPPKLAWPAADRRELSVALHKEEASGCRLAV